MSPRKLRLVADAIRDMDPADALVKLPFLEKRAAEPMRKALKTALANAEQQGLTQDQVEIEELMVNEGPRLKRGRPVARGMWHPYQRKMSHIRIILKAKASVKPKKKAVKKKKDKVKKVKSPDKIKEQIVKGKGDNRKTEDKSGKGKKTAEKPVKDRKTQRTTNK